MECEPLEGLEEPLELAGRDQRAGVDDGEVRASRLGAGGDLDPAAGDVVPDCVRDEVGDESFEQVRIAGRPGRLEHDDALESAQIVRPERLVRDRRDLDGLAPLRPAVAPGECEAGLEQPLLLPACAEDLLANLLPRHHVRVRVRERQLEEGTLGRERRAQLVRHIGREALPAHERPTLL